MVTGECLSHVSRQVCCTDCMPAVMALNNHIIDITMRITDLMRSATPCC